jgi:hypothetical protein
VDHHPLIATSGTQHRGTARRRTVARCHRVVRHPFAQHTVDRHQGRRSVCVYPLCPSKEEEDGVNATTEKRSFMILFPMCGWGPGGLGVLFHQSGSECSNSFTTMTMIECHIPFFSWHALVHLNLFLHNWIPFTQSHTFERIRPRTNPHRRSCPLRRRGQPRQRRDRRGSLLF